MMAAAEETVVLNLNLAAETEGAPAAIAEVGDALKGLATDADEARKALARVTPAESLNQMADWVSKMAGEDAAAKLMENMTQAGNSLGTALEKTGEAATVTAPAVAAVAQETAAAVPIVEASVAVTEKATDAERRHENALKTLSSGIKEYGLQAEAASELVEAFAKDEELTAEETTHLQRDLGLLGDTTEETGKVTKGAGIAFGEMFSDMAAASKGAQESKGVLKDVADEGTSATDIVGQAHTALRSLRVGLGATGVDPSLTALLGQATGLAGILDVVGPALTLVSNPVVIAAAASAGAFWLVYEGTVKSALDELIRTKGWERKGIMEAAEQGKTFWLGGEQLDPLATKGYKPSGRVLEYARKMEMGMLPFAPEAMRKGDPGKPWGGLTWDQVQMAVLADIRKYLGEQAYQYVAMTMPEVLPGTPEQDVFTRAQYFANERAKKEREEAARRVAEYMSWQVPTQGAYWGGRTPEAAERGVQLRAWTLAGQTGPTSFPFYSDKEFQEQQKAREKAKKDLADALADYDKERERQEEALAKGETARQGEVVQDWQDYIDRAPPEQRPALRRQYENWQLQQGQRMQPSRAGEGDQADEQRLLELGERVRQAGGDPSRPTPVIIVNPENTLGKAFIQGGRLGRVEQDF